MSPKEINRLHIRIMASVRRRIALETHGILLVGIACTSGKKNRNLLNWLEMMGAPPIIRSINTQPEGHDNVEEQGAKAAAEFALSIASKHIEMANLEQATSGI